MLVFTNESVLIGYGVSYLKIAGCSYLLTGISQCYLVIMKTSEHAKTTAIISSFTVCVNIILNWIFIYGAFGLEAMGVKGAALATLVARILELGCSIVISYKDGYIHPDMKRLFYRNKQLAKDFQKCACRFLVRVCSGGLDLRLIHPLWDIWVLMRQQQTLWLRLCVILSAVLVRVFQVQQELWLEMNWEPEI